MEIEDDKVGTFRMPFMAQLFSLSLAYVKAVSKWVTQDSKFPSLTEKNGEDSIREKWKQHVTTFKSLDYMLLKNICWEVTKTNALLSDCATKTLAFKSHSSSAVSSAAATDRMP